MKIDRIGHVGLTVPDLDLWTDFFCEIVGLQVTERSDSVVYLTSSHRWSEIRLTAGERYGCDGVALDVASEAVLDELVADAPRFELEVLDDGPAPGAERVVRVAGVSQPVLELCRGTHRAPVGYDGAYATLGPRPQKFGHYTFLSTDFERTSRILTEYLGFRLSDSVPAIFHWYHTNSDHHGIGLGHGPDSLHHYAFMLSSFEEFRHLGDHVVRNGRKLVWGPGRHGPGNNLFSYLLDPGGGMVELYTGMLQIEDLETYRPSEFSLEDAGNVWGPGTEAPEEWLKAGTPYLNPAAVVD